MNERIKELELQCWESPAWFDSTKFAILILDDVMSICEDLGDKGMDGHYCVDAIRNKFGLWNVFLDTEKNT